MTSPFQPTREHRLIEAIKDWTHERLIGDDCAVLPGGQLITVDTLVQDTHFQLPGTSFADLGFKAMAVNLSDIAAMAGRPRYAVVSLTLPKSVDERQVQQLYDGMLQCAQNFHCRIVGGDLTGGAAVAVTITVVGEEHQCGRLLRSGAHLQDEVIVTGDFGASAAGLWLMQNGSAQGISATAIGYCRERHNRPRPRLAESWKLVEHNSGLGALMDASDGLGDALIQIAQASGVGMVVDEALLPIASATRQVAQAAKIEVLDWALYGGEDYELVATISESDWLKLKQSPDNPFISIGKVQAEEQVLLKRSSGSTQQLTLDRTFQHW